MQSAGTVALQLILGRSGTSSQPIGFTARASPQRAGELITYSGDSHLMTFAPTGAGKTTGPVICNALTHEGQLIVIDIKGEIYAATAEARRKMGQQVHVLDLRDNDPLPGSLNPFDLISLSGTDHAAIGRSFAAELIVRDPSERHKFWDDWAETMISGAATWMLADKPPEERTLSAMFDLYTCEEMTYKLSVMMDEKERVRHRAARAAFSSYLELPSENTRPSVLATIVSHLRFLDSDMIRRLTDTSSMDLAALIAGEPMSLYIIVPPQRLSAYRPMLRVWLSSLILAMTQRAKPPKERTLLLCDEMGNLGRMDVLLTAATLMRSWGLTLWTFWQNVAQLQIYGAQATTLVDNAGVIQVFGTKNLRMAQDLVNIVGGVSAEKIMGLKADGQLLLIDGKTTLCKQARYYSDELFQGKLE